MLGCLRAVYSGQSDLSMFFAIEVVDCFYGVECGERHNRLQGASIQPSRLCGSRNRIYLLEKQERTRTQGARIAGALERQHEQLEHSVRGGSTHHIQPRKNSQRPLS